MGNGLRGTCAIVIRLSQSLALTCCFDHWHDSDMVRAMGGLKGVAGWWAVGGGVGGVEGGGGGGYWTR